MSRKHLQIFHGKFTIWFHAFQLYLYLYLTSLYHEHGYGNEPLKWQGSAPSCTKRDYINYEDVDHHRVALADVLALQCRVSLLAIAEVKHNEFIILRDKLVRYRFEKDTYHEVRLPCCKGWQNIYEYTCNHRFKRQESVYVVSVYAISIGKE